MNSTTLTTNYFETPSEQWSYIDFYKYRQKEVNFTFSFRKESFILQKHLTSLQEKFPKAKKLLENFKVYMFFLMLNKIILHKTYIFNAFIY